MEVTVVSSLQMEEREDLEEIMMKKVKGGSEPHFANYFSFRELQTKLDIRIILKNLAAKIDQSQ